MARKRHARSIEHAFDRITIDGEELSAFNASLRFDKLDKKYVKHWSKEASLLFLELGLRRYGISAKTSGTTGPPKDIRISRRDLVMSARLTARTFDLHEGDRILHCLPCDFIAGKMMVVRAFALGLDIHFIDPRGSILDNLRIEDRFKFTAMVPLQLHRAIHKDRARVERQFHMILLGGGPVSDALIADLRDLDVQVFQGYGSTETVTHVAIRSLNGPSPEDHFTAIGDCRFGRDPRGCLVVYTPHLSTPQHVTNDLVELIDETRFRWLGRYDNVILSGGKKIFPEQLEAKTAGIIPYAHYFTATLDDVLGQSVLLVLECPKDEADVMSEVMPLLMTVLHPHELPRRVRTVPMFQRTSGGKTIRHPS